MRWTLEVEIRSIAPSLASSKEWCPAASSLGLRPSPPRLWQSIERGTPGRGAFMEAVQPLRDEAASPFAHRLRLHAGSQRQGLGRRSPPGQAPQRFLFSLAPSETLGRHYVELRMKLQVWSGLSIESAITYQRPQKSPRMHRARAR
jgi:hypothetical protein